MKKKELVIISLGGSLIFPEEIDWKFVKKFKKVIKKQIADGYKFVIIAGGGKLCRKYQDILHPTQASVCPHIQVIPYREQSPLQ